MSLGRVEIVVGAQRIQPGGRPEGQCAVRMPGPQPPETARPAYRRACVLAGADQRRTVIKALFVCSQNRLRSPTAEQVFSQYEGIECESAGVHESADVPLSPELIEWADVIFLMEKAHRNKVTRKFKHHLNGKRLIVLDIPDNYGYMDETLVHLLKLKAGPFLGRHIP